MISRSVVSTNEPRRHVAVQAAVAMNWSLAAAERGTTAAAGLEVLDAPKLKIVVPYLVLFAIRGFRFVQLEDPL